MLEETNASHGRQQWKGRNRTNKWVFFPQPTEGYDPSMSRPLQPGDLVQVHIEKATSWSLQGCAVGV
jgi:tRNA-2-methylthio-N6-dimethylallyladenosine synthase